VLADATDVDARQCSLSVTKDLAAMGATLAAAGVDPLTGDAAVDAAACRPTLAVRTTAGLSETAGDRLSDSAQLGLDQLGSEPCS
jgi:glutaminase